MVDRRWGLIVTDHACPLWELASTPVHCWLLIGFAVLSAVACLHRRSALAVAAFGVIGFLLLFAIGTASLGRDGSSQATLGPWSFAVGDSVLCAVLAAYNFALIL
jgi:hypothetical protein